MTDKNIWIKPYRDAIEQQFRLDAAAQHDVDTFFNRLQGMADSCSDQGTFATTFMQSPLYQEYTALFRKYSSMAVIATGETVNEAKASMGKQATKSAAAEHAKSMVECEVNAAISHMLPDEVNRVRWAGARALPVIGPVIQWIDNIQWLHRLFKS